MLAHYVWNIGHVLPNRAAPDQERCSPAIVASVRVVCGSLCFFLGGSRHGPREPPGGDQVRSSGVVASSAIVPVGVVDDKEKAYSDQFAFWASDETYHGPWEKKQKVEACIFLECQRV